MLLHSSDRSHLNEPMIGQTLIDMRGRKPAWEGIRLHDMQLQMPWSDNRAAAMVRNAS